MAASVMVDMGRLLVVFTLCLCGSAYLHGNTNRNSDQALLDVDSHGSYRLLVGGSVWMSSADTFMTLHGKVYSTADGGLKLYKKTMEKGRDALGDWQSTSYWYQPTGYTNYTMVTSMISHSNQPFYIFRQSFPEAVPAEGAGSENSVITGFPTINTNKSAVSLGYHAFGGIMFGNTHMKSGKWGANMTSRPVSGLDSGPLLLFDSAQRALVISSFSQFMAGSAVYTSDRASWGLLGRAKNIPAGFEYSVIVYYSNQGINKAVSGWGDVLRKYYGRATTFRDSDFSNNYLGYYTDNGAYYYYKTEPNKTYEETIYDVKSYADKMKLPYRYIQYDSWWYYKGPKDGVTEWVSMDSVFPSGMRAVWNKTGWISVAHNRWWSDKTVYAKQNGGKYDFIVEPETHKALPMDPVFWDDLMRTSRQWGLITYEQDWLNVQFDEMDATVSDLEVGTRWLRQMGKAAAENGLTIQYCMSPSRHALQTLEIPVVSQARVSTDYHLSPDQWRIGVSSMFAHAMGVAPVKDNFWTTSIQPDNPYNKTEPSPALQAVVATLSTGPVAPSDRIGYSNASLIMRSCDMSGRLLKPSRPALAIDDQIKRMAAGRPIGEVWTTYTTVSGLNFGIVLGADMKVNYNLYPENAGFCPECGETRVYHYTNPNLLRPFSDEYPLFLTIECTLTAFCLYHTTPVLHWGGEELLLLGEVDKWVPMSTQRVKSISIGSTDVNVKLEGAVGEKITFHVIYASQNLALPCVFGLDGFAQLSLKDKICK